MPNTPSTVIPELPGKLDEHQVSAFIATTREQTPPVWEFQSNEIRQELEGIAPDKSGYKDLRDLMKELMEKSADEHRMAFSLTSEEVSSLPGPRVSRIMPILPIQKARSMPEGRNSLGIGALTLGVVAGSLEDNEVPAKADSGADILLISESFLASLKHPPPTKTGMRINLWELTNQSKISGYVNLTLFMACTAGKLLEFHLEAYVVPGMSVPLILGEDFMVTYKISVDRLSSPTRLLVTQGDEKLEILASSDSDWKRGFSVIRRELPGEDMTALSVQTFRKRRKHDRQQKHKRENKTAEQPGLVRARHKVILSPGTAKMIPVDGIPDTRQEWMVDRITLADNLGFLGAPASLI